MKHRRFLSRAGFLLLLVLACFAPGCETPRGPAVGRAQIADALDLDQAPLGERIGADDPNIQYIGRISFDDPGSATFAYPGVSISARFEGTGIDLVIRDTGYSDYFNVTIDDYDPVVIRSSRGERVFSVARGLRNAVHRIRIDKRTEASCGTTTFEGFNLEEGRSLVALPALPARTIEFIGDSITCGYGNMVATTDPDSVHFDPANENSYLSYGAVAARALGAQFVSTSYSGRGVFRNNDASETGTLPQIYGRTLPDVPDRAQWDVHGYLPDVIVINLGTNDYSSLARRADLSEADFDAGFAEAYGSLIERLREDYGPAVKIVCAVGPMMNDNWPPDASAWTRIQRSVSGLVDRLNQSGDAGIFYLKFEPQQAPYGEDWHPTTATHQAMADALVPLVRRATGW